MIRPDFCSEFYIVEKVIEVVVELRGKSEQFRIEALRSSTGHYDARGYILRDVDLNNPAAGDKGSQQMWVVHDLPFVDGPTADAALEQALSLLGKQVRGVG